MKIAKNGIIHGALILTAANIITRLIGFFYRIYMSNTIGAEGMGLYQLITPIYMLSYSIASAGLASTVSNLTARENAFNNHTNIKRILSVSILITTVISLILSLIIFTQNQYISICILKDSRTALSLKIISLCLPFMAIGSCIRGYFLGMRKNIIPATSQVFEQLIRMGAIFILSGTMLNKGLEFACAIAVWGMVAGEILSFVYVMLCFYFYNNKQPKKTATINYNSCITLILSMAIPLTLNRIIGSLLSTIENILIPQRLQLFGYSKSDAISIFGQLCGMAMPLIMFPSSLLTALSTALMPVISSSDAKADNTRISYTVHSSLLLTIIIGLGAGGIFIAYPSQINQIVYSNSEISLLLRFLGFICPFMYLQVILSGILNGLNKQLFIFKTGLLSSAINIFSIYFLTPKYGLHAFICSWFVSSTITSLVSFYKVSCIIKIVPIRLTDILKILFCIILAILVSLTIYKALILHINQNIALILSLCVVGIAYISLLTQTNTLPSK